MKRIICIVLSFFVFQGISAQEFNNVHFDQVGNEIHIFYDLMGVQEGDEVNVQVYYSNDQGESWQGPLESVIGDVGNSVQPGKDKRIVWNVLQEKEQLTGDIQFQVRGDIMETEFPGKSGMFKDERDGQKYHWVRVQNLVWMADNLNYETEEGSWCVSKDCFKGGKYYTYSTAEQACPDGWHLPSKTEWLMFQKGLKRIKMNKEEEEKDKKVLKTLKDIHGTEFISSLWGYKKGNDIKLEDVLIGFWTSSISPSSKPDNKMINRVIINRYNPSIMINVSEPSNGLNVRCVTGY